MKKILSVIICISIVSLCACSNNKKGNEKQLRQGKGHMEMPRQKPVHQQKLCPLKKFPPLYEKISRCAIPRNELYLAQSNFGGDWL